MRRRFWLLCISFVLASGLGVAQLVTPKELEKKKAEKKKIEEKKAVEKKEVEVKKKAVEKKAGEKRETVEKKEEDGYADCFVEGKGACEESWDVIGICGFAGLVVGPLGYLVVPIKGNVEPPYYIYRAVENKSEECKRGFKDGYRKKYTDNAVKWVTIGVNVGWAVLATYLVATYLK